MPTAIEVAVETYIAACQQRDPTLRQTLFEASLADDVRMVTRSRQISGRDRLVAELTRSLDDPRLVGVQLISAVDAQGTTFRYRALARFRDGSSAETFDVGEVDTQGRISLILTFAGALAERSA